MLPQNSIDAWRSESLKSLETATTTRENNVCSRWNINVKLPKCDCLAVFCGSTAIKQCASIYASTSKHALAMPCFTSPIALRRLTVVIKKRYLDSATCICNARSSCCFFHALAWASNSTTLAFQASSSPARFLLLDLNISLPLLRPRCCQFVTLPNLVLHVKPKSRQVLGQLLSFFCYARIAQEF